MVISDDDDGCSVPPTASSSSTLPMAVISSVCLVVVVVVVVVSGVSFDDTIFSLNDTNVYKLDPNNTTMIPPCFVRSFVVVICHVVVI